jgi:uncharacterized protein YqjF (DUF2071 family)
MLNDFDYSILNVTDHRPWPMPASPWLMTQSWHDLLFAHWPVEPGVLRDKVPACFPIDVYKGHAWIGVVPFHMTNVAPRAVPPLPWVSAFPELNVRTYVTVDGKPGVYFFSLDAANPVAVGVARTLVHLPYYMAEMKVQIVDGWIQYRSRRTSPRAETAELVARYRPVGDITPPRENTLEHFLTERYCLYTSDSGGRPYRLEIHHARWPLQAAEAHFSANTMASAAGVQLPRTEPLLHFAKRQDMVAWGLERIG